MKELTVFDADLLEEKLFRQLSTDYQIKLYFDIDNPSTTISISHRTLLNHKRLKQLKERGVVRIYTRSIGVNHIDCKSAQALNIEVRNILYKPDSVADFTLLQILLTLRERGKNIQKQTIGVIGKGRIGEAVGQRLESFGSQVLYYDRKEELTDFLGKIDILSLHLPLTNESYHFLGREAFEKMKDGIMIFNTSRGELIDSHSLLEGIQRKKVAFALLDVLESEVSEYKQLKKNPNVKITPHIAYYSEETLREIIEKILREIEGEADA